MIALALLAAAASPAPALPDWMAGSWLHCTAAGQVSETWSDARGGVMLGTSKTIGARTSWELSRIARTPEGLAFFAEPEGQPPAEFAAIEQGEDRIVFENKAHDFPQRITYRREGNRLIARIEGVVDGQPRSAEWRYDAAALNAACPR